MKKYAFIFILIFMICFPIYSDTLGPTSKLYFTKWLNGGIGVIQGLNIIDSWGTSASSEIAIAVDKTVKTFGHRGFNGNTGAEYALDGSFTGTIYSNTNVPTTCDGTTDGQYLYSVGWSNNGAVAKYDQNWNNYEILFYGPTGAQTAITYDPTNNSFWLGDYNAGIVYNYDYNGNLLSQFSTEAQGVTSIAALALDHADNTLWFTNHYGSTFYQYTKDGEFLGSYNTGISGYGIYAAEFALATAVPEANTILLFLFFIIFIGQACFFQKTSFLRRYKYLKGGWNE